MNDIQWPLAALNWLALLFCVSFWAGVIFAIQERAVSEGTDQALIAALGAPFSECATAISEKLKEANLFLASKPCFVHCVSDEEALLFLRKDSGEWELSVSVPSDRCPVSTVTANVQMKFHAARLLPKFYNSYAKEMQRRVREMERLVFPEGKPVDAREYQTK